jgi:putative ABC transport system permease protein
MHNGHSHDASHDWRTAIRARVSSARLHPQDEADLVEEIAQHLELQFEELARRIGAGPARDRLLAQLSDREFDDALGRRRRRARPSQARTWRSTSVWRDVRYGMRSLRRSPGLVVAGTAALALGIGLTTMMFSIIYGMFIKGLPYDDAPRIAMAHYTNPAEGIEEMAMPLGDFTRYRARQRSFETVGGYALGTATVAGGDRPDRVGISHATAGLFEVTRVRPMLGRTFTAGDNDPAAPATAVLSYAMWRDRYAGDSSAIGKTVRVNARPFTIIGVMPERYTFPQPVQIWLPLQTDATSLQPGEGPALSIVGRLKPNVSYEQANAELGVVSQQLGAERKPVAELHAVVRPFIRAVVPVRAFALLYAMLGAVFLVLLVACANVANLLLDRAANRTREIGIRVALGASRMAVVRQSLVESGILAGLAAIFGTGLAQAGIVAFNRATLGADLPFWVDVQLHVPVLVFVIVVAILASIVSGLLPAIHSARLDITTILKDESQAASLRVGKLSRAIVIAELGLSTAILLAAGFITKSIVRLDSVEPGFATADVFSARITLPAADSLRHRQFFETLEHDLAAVPGVDGVYLGNGLPGTGWRGGRNGDPVALEGRVYARPQDYASARSLAVSPGFFRAFGVAALRGRAILTSDRRDTPRVAVISEGFARRYFPDAEPIGRRIRFGEAGSEGAWLTIVGVMPTLYAAGIQSASEEPWPPEVLTALWQEDRFSSASIAWRGSASVATAATLRKVVAALDPEVAVYAAATMDEVLARPMKFVHVFGTMFVVFGVVSLVLAAIGLYAVMAFSVTRRVREMGIRMALGATSRDVIRLVCRQGATQILIGMTLGLVMGAGLVRLVSTMLFEFTPKDPMVFAVVAGVLGAVALVACIIPAIGATRVDPLIALRTD